MTSTTISLLLAVPISFVTKQVKFPASDVVTVGIKSDELSLLLPYMPIVAESIVVTTPLLFIFQNTFRIGYFSLYLMLVINVTECPCKTVYLSFATSIIGSVKTRDMY